MSKGILDASTNELIHATRLNTRLVLWCDDDMMIDEALCSTFHVWYHVGWG
jgi:hypothetical protein